jgi:hypothetical protein
LSIIQPDQRKDAVAGQYIEAPEAYPSPAADPQPRQLPESRLDFMPVLADAYVYLGRSQVAQGNIAAARGAFAKLKTVPNISPRVLRLWELYADTLE